jgi:hypothetical protein
MNPLLQTTFFGYPSNTYWGQTLTNFRFTSLTTDGSENVYLAGFDIDGAGNSVDVQTFNFDPYGAIKWQKSIGSGISQQFPQISRSNNGNLYISVRTTWNPTSTYEAASLKYNSSGTLQWQRRLTGYTGTGAIGVAIDSNENQYYSGYTDVGGGNSNYQALFYKRNSAGTLQWQRIFGTTSSPGGQDFPKKVVIDKSENNVYVLYTTYVGATRSYVAKYNLSGTLQWQKYLGHYTVGMSTDNNDYIYIAGAHSSGNPYVMKFDSSGTTQWSKTLGCSGRYHSVYVYNDNVYCAGVRGNYPSTFFLMTKYDSLGNLQWQRELSYSGRSVLPENDDNGIAADSRGNIYYCTTGYSPSAPTWMGIFLKLPENGSKIGTYGNYTISQSAYSDSSVSISLTTDGIGDSAASMSESASSWSESTPSWSPTFTSI